MPYFAAAGLALSVGSFIGGNKANKKAKKAQKKAFNTQQAWSKGRVQAQVDALLDSKQEGVAKAATNMGDIARAGLIMRGRLSTSAGESGTAGNSVTVAFTQSFFEQARAVGAEIYNYDLFQKQVNRDIRAVQSGAQVAEPEYTSTSKLEGGLNLIGDALSIANTAGWLKPKTPPVTTVTK